MPKARDGLVKQKLARVIGIGRFADQSVPALHFTTADASGIADALKDPGIGRFPPANVHILTDELATTKNIKEQLNWIARHAEPSDLVLIYVATQGTPRTLDSAGSANYLVTYDTKRSERRRALRHRLSHGGVGERRGNAHEVAADSDHSRHVLQWRFRESRYTLDKDPKFGAVRPDAEAHDRRN